MNTDHYVCFRCNSSGRGLRRGLSRTEPRHPGPGRLAGKAAGWSASLSRIGAGAYGGELPGRLAAIARFASSPAGMFAGLLTAAKMTAHAGDEIVHLAEKAGTSVEAISSLAYAARRAEVSADSLATGIKKMQVNITAAARGGEEATEVFARLGLSAAELARLQTEEQFRRIADRIADHPEPDRAGRDGREDLWPQRDRAAAASVAGGRRDRQVGSPGTGAGIGDEWRGGRGGRSVQPICWAICTT